MTDIDDVRMPAEVLLTAVRRAVDLGDDEPTVISASDRDALARLRILRTEWIRAAWHEIREASVTRSRAAAADHSTMSLVEYTDAVCTATRWTSACLASTGSGFEDVDAAFGQAVTAGYALLIARHGADAANLIREETETAVSDGYRSPRHGV